MKLSISLDNDSTSLLMAIVEEEDTNPSKFIQKAIKEYAQNNGWEIIPAQVMRKVVHIRIDS